MNLDPKNHSLPETFHGFRFVKPDVLEHSLSNGLHERETFQVPDTGKSSSFVELSDWQLWGTGKSAWYVISRCKLQVKELFD